MTDDEWAGTGDLVCQILGMIYVERRSNFEEAAREREITLEQLDGIFPRDATVSAVAICVKPGPQVTEATPTLPVAR